MKKFFALALLLLVGFTLAACELEEGDSDPYEYDTLTVFFVPSRDAQYILETTEPLKELLKEELARLGITVGEVIIEVGTTYEAVGEGMVSGTVDVGFLPGGTYALYSQTGNVDVALAATRAGLNKDSANAADWNDGEPTTGDPTNQVTYYRSLIVAGPSAVGQALAAKVNNGEALTWEDVNSATWCLQGPTSSAGTVYPSVLLYNMFGKKVTDLDNSVNAGGYGPSMSQLAAGNCDVSTIYADARRDYAVNWTKAVEDGGYGRTESIWTETSVILVTGGIFNDTISISSVSVNLTLKLALQLAFINIINTPAGKEIFEVYNHQGYKVVVDADYEDARTAQQIILGD
jgi:phosphonate transport system substrate-binding protein